MPLAFRQLVAFNLAMFLVLLLSQWTPTASRPIDQALWPKFFAKLTHTTPIWQDSTLVIASPPALPTPQAPLVAFEFNDDNLSIFHASPPSALDYSLLLNQLSQLGVRRLAILPPLVWPPQAGEKASLSQLTIHSLEQELSAFPSLSLSSKVTRSPISPPRPAAIERSLIPQQQVHGDIGKLIAADQLSFPLEFLPPTQAHLFPLQSEVDPPFLSATSPNTTRVPLLLRWQDRLIPSFSLGLCLQSLGLSPQDCTVHLGEFLQLGPSRRLPIDDAACFVLPNSPPPALQSIDAADLLSQEKSQQAALIQKLKDTPLVLLLRKDSGVPKLAATAKPTPLNELEFALHVAQHLRQAAQVFTTQPLAHAASRPTSLAFWVLAAALGVATSSFRKRFLPLHWLAFTLLCGVLLFQAKLHLDLLWPQLAWLLAALLTRLLPEPKSQATLDLPVED